MHAHLHNYIGFSLVLTLYNITQNRHFNIHVLVAPKPLVSATHWWLPRRSSARIVDTPNPKM